MSRRDHGEISEARTVSTQASTGVSYSVPGNYAGIPADYYRFADVNRDGLPDLVPNNATVYPGSALLNYGPLNPITQTHWRALSANVTLPSYDPGYEYVADLDGDGNYDVLEDLGTNGRGVVFGTGTDFSPYTVYPSVAPGNDGGYLTWLQQYDSTPSFGATLGGNRRSPI